MESNPYEPPDAKSHGQTPSKGRRVLVGCLIAGLVGLALFIALFTVCTAIFFVG